MASIDRNNADTKLDVDLESVDAIRKQKILTIEGDLIAIEGPRLIEGMTLIAEFLYPDFYR